MVCHRGSVCGVVALEVVPVAGGAAAAVALLF